MQRYIDAASAGRRSDAHRFKRFHPTMFKPGSIGVMIGKKGSGKTTMLMDLCYWLRDCPEVYLFQKTYNTNKAFWGIIPDLCCYDEWRPDVIRGIMKRQAKVNKRRMRQGKPPHYVTLVVDDCAGNKEFTKDPILQELFYNARHLKINVIFTVQYSLNMSSDLRAQFDWIFMMREALPNNRKRLNDHFCGHFGSGSKGFDEFVKIFARVTQDNGVLVFHNTAKGTEISDMYYFYKAKLRSFNEVEGLKRWKMGSRAMWALNARHYDPHWDSDDDSQVRSDELVIERVRR